MNLRKINDRIPKEIIAWAEESAESTRSKFASYIVYRYGEIVERIFATRKYSRGGVKITEVIRRDTSGRSRTITKNMTYSQLAGYSPQYERKDRVASNGWGYRTFNKEWFDVWYDVYDSFLPPNRKVINPEILAGIEEFKYCGYSSGDIVSYIRAYRKNKGVEFIGKLDLPLSKALIKKCEGDKSFRSYLYKNHQSVRPMGVRALIYAYDHHMTIEQARAALKASKTKSIEGDFAKSTEKAKSLIYKDNGLIIFPPDKPADLVAEGDALEHCVGRMGYDKKPATGTSFIMFVRKELEKDKPYVTVEYDPDSKKILQSYGHKNTKPEPMVQEFLTRWIQEVTHNVKSSNQI